jgi:hypothetical protein
MSSLITRRTFAKVSATAVAAAVAPAIPAAALQPSPTPTENAALQSEFLLDLAIDAQSVNNVGSLGVNRLIVPVAGGTFEGPSLKGTIVGPSGDWIVGRPDGSLLLDVRLVLQTDDAEKIYMTWRGVSYTPQGGAQYSRILPMFETGAKKYVWLNNIVAVGVHKPLPGKVAYRVYRIL